MRRTTDPASMFLPDGRPADVLASVMPDARTVSLSCTPAPGDGGAEAVMDATSKCGARRRHRSFGVDTLRVVERLRVEVRNSELASALFCAANSSPRYTGSPSRPRRVCLRLAKPPVNGVWSPSIGVPGSTAGRGGGEPANRSADQGDSGRSASFSARSTQSRSDRGLISTHMAAMWAKHALFGPTYRMSFHPSGRGSSASQIEYCSSSLTTTV